MAINTGLFSSAKHDWATPQALFDQLDAEFDFTLDVCATPDNAKCPQYYTPDMDGLKQDWLGTCWCNPPYGRQIGKWVAKAAAEAEKGSVVVMLVPARTDTAWFQDYLLQPGVQLRFIRGRLKFGGAKQGAPFPSVVAVLGADAQDVSLVVHGHWMDDKYVWRCSNCHKWLDVTQGDGRMRYCPNCGAKMAPLEDRGDEL
mgnify:CR=1 FL=1